MEMMVIYANNLEVLVNERTQLLYEEKQKTEDLLHRMLPKSVNRTFWFPFKMLLAYPKPECHTRNATFQMAGVQFQTRGSTTDERIWRRTGIVWSRHHLFQRYRRLYQNVGWEYPISSKMTLFNV